MPTATPTPTRRLRRVVPRTPAPNYGTMEMLEAKDMTVLHHIQRRPTDSRLRQLQPWDVTKEGLIFVAKITDGLHVGTRHPYDGGTRVLYQQTYGDPSHVFQCWVKEMTEQEAAEAFLVFNTESRRPSAYFQYMVALEAGREWAKVVDSVTRAKGIQVAEHSTSTKISAVQACQRIVEARSHANMAAAEAHFAEVLDVSMAAYPGSPEAYNSDIIQAVSRILIDHGALVDHARLVGIIARKSAGQWSAAAQAARERDAVTSLGSESRANNVRREIIAQYNKRLAASRKLV